MIAAIHQPNYLPFLGFFHKMARADLFILLDDVPFTKTSFTQRVRIKMADGVHWLTVPVRTRGRRGEPISAVEISADPDWSRRHGETLRRAYGKAPHFRWAWEVLEPAWMRPVTRLADLNVDLVGRCAELLGLRTKRVLASTLDGKGAKSARLASLCVAAGADVYLSGPTGRNYLDMPVFERAGVQVKFSTFQHPVWRQGFGPFVPHLSLVDLLFNEGPQARAILEAADGVGIGPDSVADEPVESWDEE